MTFTTTFKEELSKIKDNEVDKLICLSSFLSTGAKIEDIMIINSETASIIRKIYTDLKEIYSINPSIKVRTQKRFREKRIYMLEISEKLELIKKDMVYDDILEFCDTPYKKVAFLKGTFLSGGSITDPKNSGYHLEFSSSNEKLIQDINIILLSFRFSSKILKRGSKFIVYVKAAEEISDLLKMFKTINSLFYFEDIRIYRDHKNMVNRLTNCEIANQEKIIKTGLKQVDSIEFLKDNNLLDLLDDKLKCVVKYRELYPDASYSELAELISEETDYKIGKSGINHNFIKINKLVEKYKEGNKNE
ncbi:MAG: DNA-binding protein WhiA [bacterium]